MAGVRNERQISAASDARAARFDKHRFVLPDWFYGDSLGENVCQVIIGFVWGSGELPTGPQWMVAMRHPEDACMYAAELGLIPILQWSLQFASQRAIKRAIVRAVQTDHLNVVTYLYSPKMNAAIFDAASERLDDVSAAVEKAIDEKHEEMVQAIEWKYKRKMLDADDNHKKTIEAIDAKYERMIDIDARWP